MDEGRDVKLFTADTLSDTDWGGNLYSFPTSML